MKISEFSSRFNMSPETVRYYVNEGLLVPHSRNNRYDFTENDVTDMEYILKLKSFRFSLHEVHRILVLKRLSNFDSSEELDDYIDILKKQKKILLKEQEDLKKTLKSMEQEIAGAFHKKNEDENTVTGVPFQAIPYLACPKCQEKLSLVNCSIEDQEIIEGKLICSCGYHADIHRGIIVGEIGEISPYDGMDVERYCYRMMSPELLSLVEKSYYWIRDRLTGEELSGKIVFEDCINNYCFLYTNLPFLDSKALYIISDKYEEVVFMYKKLIEKLGIKRNILYIASGMHHLPLRHKCVDYYLDFDSANEYAILYNSFSINQVEEYLADSAEYIGAFFHMKQNGPSVQKLHEQYPEAWSHSFDERQFKWELSVHWDEIEYEEDYGMVTDSGYGESFSYHVDSEELWLSTYACKR